MSAPFTVVPGSFRDPSGFVYTIDGTLYRQINKTFSEEFDACTTSGLYDDLSAGGLLVPHRQVSLDRAATSDAYAVIEPARIDFISYPYEWTFGALKDAALLTLDIQDRALSRDFVLRDASAFNVQFRGAQPVFIDTLSFARYREGEPWAPYRQFAQHFLAPLALMSIRDIRCSLLQRHYLDGIPLDLASTLLPFRTWARVGMLVHLHLHARASRRYAAASVAEIMPGRRLSRRGLQGLLGSLRATIESLTWRAESTTWAAYASDHNYSETALMDKQRLVRSYVRSFAPRMIWDLGGNTGIFARVAREAAESVICFDADAGAVELNYRQLRERQETGILPLVLDLMNPSAAMGWAQQERLSLDARGPADMLLALALVHHLAIANNVPLPRIAEAFARLGRALLIEFVPKSDSQVVGLLRNRPDIFAGYTVDGFERAFARHYTIVAKQQISGSERWLYMMARQ